MKTQIIHLDRHDDVISARDKIDWAKTARVLLVWPDRGRILTSRLDLVLIARRCREVGAQLALVTRDSRVRANARIEGIPIYSSVERAQSAPVWRGDHRHTLPFLTEVPLANMREIQPARRIPPAWQQNIFARLAIFLVGILSVLSLVALFVPAANITLALPQKEQQISIVALPSTTETQVRISGALPATETRLIVETSGNIPSSGEVDTPTGTAKGEVKFSNLTNQPVTIPSGTVVIAGSDIPARRYFTIQSASVPAGVGKSALVPIKASQPGSTGNLESGAIQGIEGDLGLSLSVTNPEAVSGGSDVRSAAPSQADRDRLRAMLMEKLKAQAASEIAIKAGSANQFVPGSLQPGKILSEADNPASAVASDRLDMDILVEFKGLTVSREHIRQLAALNLDAALPVGYKPVSEDLEITSQSTSETSGKLGLSIRAARKIEPVVDLTQVAKAVLGLRPTDASVRLKTLYQLDELPVVQLTPAWWPRLPVLAFQVAVSD